MLTNIILEYDGVTVITELQVHHKLILEYNDRAHAHDPYEFFRSLFAGAYEDDMDAMLERAILFLEEVKGVPVLLSMLVLLFKHHKEGSTEPLPANRYELYVMAMRLACTNSGDLLQCCAMSPPVISLPTSDASSLRCR
jgi:hypothetical protein